MEKKVFSENEVNAMVDATMTDFDGKVDEILNEKLGYTPPVNRAERRARKFKKGLKEYYADFERLREYAKNKAYEKAYKRVKEVEKDLDKQNDKVD